MLIFSIKNEKLGYFNRPIYCESKAEALSYIQNVLMSDADRALVGLKNDLSLYELGYIDFSSGIIDTYHNSIDDNGNVVVDNEPLLVCSLAEIFDSIPADKLKPALTKDDFKLLVSRLEVVQRDIIELSQHFENHTHTHKKGVCVINENS